MNKVVVLGANGAMGAGSGEVFAAAGIPVVFLARTRDKAAAGRRRAESMAKAEALSRLIEIGTYDDDLERECADADLIFEAVSENIDLKRTFFERVDRVRKAGSIVATVSSGLSIADMTAGRSDSFASHFLGIHFFNPPNVIVGCELVPHAKTDPAVTEFVAELLDGRLGREVIRTSDTPAFAGNRVGFKVLNEVAQLALEHGVAFLDQLLGPHTGRAMAPLVTIDFVGWDVHKAIVDNLQANTDDEANEAFALPAYMQSLIDSGHLGAKTPDKGGFFRKDGDTQLVLEPAAGGYRPLAEVATEAPDFVVRMKQLNRVGRYAQAMDVFATARGGEADLMRRIILGYISYGLNRVGSVVEAPRDVDRIMGFGFNWAPPSVLADTIGLQRTVTLLEAAGLPVPPILIDAAERRQKLFDEPTVDSGRFFFA